MKIKTSRIATDENLCDSICVCVSFAISFFFNFMLWPIALCWLHGKQLLNSNKITHAGSNETIAKPPDSQDRPTAITMRFGIGDDLKTHVNANKQKLLCYYPAAPASAHVNIMQSVNRCPIADEMNIWFSWAKETNQSSNGSMVCVALFIWIISIVDKLAGFKV